MKISRISVVFFLFFSAATFAQVGINTDYSSPDPSAMLEVKSTNSGLLIPRLSGNKRDLIPSPAAGLLIFNTTSNQFNYYNGTAWYQVESSFISSGTGSARPGGGVSISTVQGAQPDSSAMLDVMDTLKGILIPRTIPGAISSPVSGLMVYNINTNTLAYFNGSEWITLCGTTLGTAGASGSQAVSGIAVNTDGSLPHQSAILDVSAPDKGLLIPRLSPIDRDDIMPVTGLTIYNTSSREIEFFNGAGWHKLNDGFINAPVAGTHTSTQTQIIWNWNPVSGASGYKWGLTNDFSEATDMGTATAKTETGLQCGNNYTRYIWAFTICGHSTATVLSHLTDACDPFTCGTDITVSHSAGAVAPVNKTVTYGTVTGIPGATDKCWITRNLGSSRQATSVDDSTEASAGWYWQFNRKQGYKHDGINRIPNIPWISSISENYDWQPVNDPCTIELGPEWRLPTKVEWESVDGTGGWYNWNGPWNSDLKLHTAGLLTYLNGSLNHRGVRGYYWSRTMNATYQGFFLSFRNDNSYVAYDYKAFGVPLRCLRDN